MTSEGRAVVRTLQRALGARMRAARERAGLSQTQLAAQVGVTPPTISALENGHRGPSMELLCRVAVALKLSPGSLLPPLREISGFFSATDIVSQVIRELDEEEATP